VTKGVDTLRVNLVVRIDFTPRACTVEHVFVSLLHYTLPYISVTEYSTIYKWPSLFMGPAGSDLPGGLGGLDSPTSP